MAFFGVTNETIDTVRNHPAADRLDICTLVGMKFQFITGRDSYKPGDEVLYFPVDSLFPFERMEQLDLVREKKVNGKVVVDERGDPIIEGALRGKKHNRLKTIRLRGELSQGLVASLDMIEPLAVAYNHPEDLTSEEITEYLGIEKYEPPSIPCQHGNLLPLPGELSIYDIEGADRFGEVAKRLMGIKVAIAEKLEGMNFSATYHPPADEFFVNQRGYTIVPLEDGGTHMFWALVNKMALRQFMESMGGDFESITLYGEFIGPGVQKNIYKLKDHEVRFFDIKIDGHFLNVNDKLKILTGSGTSYKSIVPTLALDETLEEWLDGRTIQEASNGISILNPAIEIIREGIVITPMEEDWDSDIGRLIIKQRSPEYLANE